MGEEQKSFYFSFHIFQQIHSFICNIRQKENWMMVAIRLPYKLLQLATGRKCMYLF